MVWRYSKPVKTTAAPQHLLSVGYTTRPPSGRPKKAESVKLIDQWSAIYRRRQRGSWRPPITRGSDDPQKFWELVERLSKKGTKVWIVVPHVGDFMALLMGWERIEQGFLRLPGMRHDDKFDPKKDGKQPKRGAVVMGGQSELVVAKVKSTDGWICVVGTRNYTPAGLDEIAESVLGRLSQDTADLVRADGLHECAAAQAEVIGTWIAETINWWLVSDAGPWQITAAKLSHSVWKRQHHTHRICEHSELEPHELERDAVYGGRAEAYFYGDVDVGRYPHDQFKGRPPWAEFDPLRSKLHRIDVSSMYPSILATCNLPVRFIDYNKSPSLNSLKGNGDRFGVLASVTVTTDKPLYPCRIPGTAGFRWVTVRDQAVKVQHRTEERICYPTGEFRTVLCGPELQHAYETGRIKEVHRTVTYVMAPAFQQLSRWLWEVRSAAKDAKNPVAEATAKLLANAFSGRWAQRPAKWVDMPMYLPQADWGTWADFDPFTDRPTLWRSVCGVTQMKLDPKGQIRGFPAIFAWVTSHGRNRMRQIMECCPPRTVIQVDTDGAYLTPAGRKSLSKLKGWPESGMGAIRDVRQHEAFRAFGPRHYWCDGKWTLAGIRCGFSEAGAGIVRETVRVQGLQAGFGRPESVREVERVIDVRDMRFPCRVGADGWMEAERLSIPVPQPIPDGPGGGPGYHTITGG